MAMNSYRGKLSRACARSSASLLSAPAASPPACRLRGIIDIVIQNLGLGDKAVLQQYQQRLDAMPGADFLAFVQAPRIVADGNFIDPMSQPNRFGGDFRAEIKPAALQIHL